MSNVSIRNGYYLHGVAADPSGGGGVAGSWHEPVSSQAAGAAGAGVRPDSPTNQSTYQAGVQLDSNCPVLKSS